MSKPKTFLNSEVDGLKYNEQFIDGIRHTQRTIDDNNDDEFYFEECQTVDFIHSLGTVYLFDDGTTVWGYVANGYAWYRFQYVDLKLINN